MKRAVTIGICAALVSVAYSQTPGQSTGLPDQQEHVGAPAGAPVGGPPGGPPAEGPPGGGPPPGFPGGAPLPHNVKVPRTKSGKPNFAGVWGHSFFEVGDKPFYPLGAMPDVSMLKPWARDEYVRRFKAFRSGNQIPNTSMMCVPAGAVSVMMEAHALQIIQTETEIIFLAESDHQIRIVYINGKHPANLLPTWYGDAIAHWEGDTLVMDTVAINDKSQLDPMGTPHSAALHVTERLSYLDTGQVNDVVTLDDPLTLEHPWTYPYHYSKGLMETNLENVTEYACAENNKDGYVPPEPKLLPSPRDL